MMSWDSIIKAIDEARQELIKQENEFLNLVEIELIEDGVVNYGRKD